MMKKQQILDAATALYLENGYGGVSMDLVARGAKVSKATLYAHFSDKRELFKQALANYYQIKNIEFPRVPALLAANLDEFSIIFRDYLHDCFRFYSDDSVVRLYRLLIAEVKQFPELFDLFFNDETGQMTAKLALYFESYAKTHELTHISSYLLACQILDLVRGATIWTKLVQNPAKLHFMDNPAQMLGYLHSSAMLLVKNYFKEETR